MDGEGAIRGCPTVCTWESHLYIRRVALRISH